MSGAGQMQELFGVDKAMIGMVHVQATPGSPFAKLPVEAIVETAVQEARQLVEAGFDAIMIENMHDRPYLRGTVGPEVIAVMAAVLDAVRQVVQVPIGVQILAGANREALSVAVTGGANFIRAENFTFAHVADEGLMSEAAAGPLLRCRRDLQAEHIRIFADVKKKHSSHSITADIDMATAAEAAAFFGADGVVVTGSASGRPAVVADVYAAGGAVELPILVGSGITAENLSLYWPAADAFIVGSDLKQGGRWDQPLDAGRIAAVMEAARTLRTQELI